jgi:AAA family ATP:ADP antiporter
MLSAGLFLASLPLSRFAGNAVPARARAKQISRADNIMTKALGGLGLVLQDRYLLSLATLVVMLNWITTTGEYVMSDYVVQLSMTLPEGERQAMIAAFMGDLFSWITIFSSGIQLLLVSRIIITFGVKVAVAIPPLIFAISFVGMAAIPALIVMKWGVIAIKSLDYSLLNTCRNALLLPASREAKYEAKTAIDTFFFRCGDLVAAGTVFIGADLLGWGHRQFLVFDAILALVMVAIAISAGREYARKAERPEFQSAPEPGR